MYFYEYWCFIVKKRNRGWLREEKQKLIHSSEAYKPIHDMEIARMTNFLILKNNEKSNSFYRIAMLYQPSAKLHGPVLLIFF